MYLPTTNFSRRFGKQVRLLALLVLPSHAVYALAGVNRKLILLETNGRRAKATLEIQVSSPHKSVRALRETKWGRRNDKCSRCEGIPRKTHVCVRVLHRDRAWGSTRSAGLRQSFVSRTTPSLRKTCHTNGLLQGCGSASVKQAAQRYIHGTSPPAVRWRSPLLQSHIRSAPIMLGNHQFSNNTIHP